MRTLDTAPPGSSDRDQDVTRKHRKDQAGRWRASTARRRAPKLRFEQLEARLAMTGVVINEFLASNTAGIVDQDGDRNDWIELKNTDPAPVDITGWHLTDESGNLAKWTLPATVLAPGAKLTIFASDKNRAVAGQELHTNFKLAIEGEYLALVSADGTTVVDSFAPYPAQREDVSYGTGTNPSSTASETLVGGSSSLKVISPTAENATVDDHWREIGFNDAAWLSGTGSVGFDRDGGINGNLAPHIGRTLTTGEMPSADPARYTAYLRYSFNLANKDQLTSLLLNLRFDDGFIAYINGREVTRANFGEDFTRPQPSWDSRAGYQLGSSSTLAATNRGTEATTAVPFDLTPYLPSLVDGTNVLAFHVVNSASTSGTGSGQDFLLEPVLTATRTSGSQLGFMAGPTPGGENGVSSLGFVGDTHFSVDRGFFDAPFQVAITTDAPLASIRYTTDGSMPTSSTGTVYSGPINITTTTILRAIAYQAGLTSSNVDTQTYIFLADVIGQNASDAPASATWGHDKPADADTSSGYNLDPDDVDWDMDPDVVTPNMATIINDLKSIPSVSLVMNWTDLFGGTPLPGTPAGSGAVAPAPQGMYIHGTSSERYASFEYFNPANAADQVHADVAVEVQGHSSTLRWNTDKLSIQVKFKYPYGDTELNYPLFAGTPDGESATSEFDTLILDAGYNYGWLHNNAAQRNYARYVTDQVVSDLQNLASGGGQAPHGKYVHVYLNGLYWGLYDMHERPDDSFAAEYYDGDKDDYHVVKSSNNDVNHEFTFVEGGLAAEASYLALLTATRAVESSPSSVPNYAAVQGMLDIDQFVDYMIVHYYAGGGADWPHNNWYGTKNTQAGGQWRFHAWDQEHAFPTTDNGDSWSQTTNITPEGPEDLESPGEIHFNLMANAEYRLRFSDRVQELMYNGGALTPAVAQAVYEARTNEIDRAIVAESARWGDNRDDADPLTRADFLSVKNGVLSTFFPVRTGLVLGHFDTNGWIPTLDAPLYSQYGGNIASGYSLTISKPGGSPPGGKIYYTLDGSDPRAADGGIGATAIEYTGPVQLFNSKNVQARIFDGTISGTLNDWSPLVDKTFLTPNTFPVRITELNYNPPTTSGVADEQNLEFMELLNTGSSAVSLDNVQITSFSNTPYVFTSGLTLNPGQRIIVAKNPTVFQQIYGNSINLAPGGYGTQNLSNGGETVTLLGPAGETLQTIVYADAGLWPTSPDGGGPSLEIIDPLGDPSSPSNWRASAIPGGSPGTGGMLGDFDDNGQVDGNDFLAWQRGLGRTAPNGAIAHGDADGDHDVDAADLGVWKGEYGGPMLVAAVVAASEESADEAIAPVLASDEWIVASTLSVMRASGATTRVRHVDAAFAAWNARPTYRPLSAATLVDVARRGLLAEDTSDDDAIECELDKALAAGLE
jgi:hypothetical protein